MNKDLKIIKKKYGEKMAHLCRKLFPSILESDGLLPKLLLDHFEPSHMLYDDIVINDLVYNFEKYICSFIENKEIEEKNMEKTPKELLDEVGYILYECHTEKDIQQFKKFYAKGEILCTFNGGRLNSCCVFFAVKKNVNEIKREDFSNPKRQDLYGTSVISIQFTKDDTHTLSIKNRYNHTVKNPDSTFSNNLDNIIDGLTESFARFYGMVQTHKSNGFEIPGYVKANDGKLYKYNYEINNIYYCPNNIIIDNFKVKKYEKEKYLIFDYFILDLVNKKIYLYDKSIEDCFPKTIIKIEKIEIKNTTENKLIYIALENEEMVTIKLNENNQLTGYINNNIVQVDDCFLSENNTLSELFLPNLKIVGDHFLNNNLYLEKLNLPSLEITGDNFIFGNNSIIDLNLPKLKKVGNCFLKHNYRLKRLNLPKLQFIGLDFLYFNNSIKKLDLPSLKNYSKGFLYYNDSLILLKIFHLKLFSKKLLERFLYVNRENNDDKLKLRKR